MSESIEYMNEQFFSYMQQDPEQFRTGIREWPLEELYLITPKYLMPYLCYIKEQKRLFLTALKNTKTLRLEQMYDHMFCFVFDPILERYQVLPERRKYIMAFYIQGIKGIITEWLKRDCDDTVEQIMGVIQQCIARGNV